MAMPNLDPLTSKIGTFEYWVQKVMPLVYDDSLSYYELLNKVVQQLNAIGAQTNELTDLWNEINTWMLGEGLEQAVNDKLDEMVADGTLDQIINVNIFNNKLDKSEFYGTVGVSVTKHGAVGDGTDESIKIQLAIDELVALGGGTLRFPKGRFVFNNVTIPAGKFISIEGIGGRQTILENTTGQLFIVGGATNTDYFKLKDVHIISTNNNAYDKALFQLKYVRNVVLEGITSIISGTGTLFELDSTYVIDVKDSMIRMGRYGVAFDMINKTSPSEQQDTFRFSNVVIFANVGVIQRRTGGNYHGVTFDGLKVLNLNVDGDFGAFAETTTSAEYASGATQINVASTAGFAPSEPIVIGHGEFVEMNKIASISGNTLFLTKPLRFTQVVGRQVLKSGVCVSLANPFNVLMTGSHFEGHPISVMVDGAKGLDFISNYVGTGEFIRICGGSQDIKIGTTIMDGTDRNIVVKVPAWNTDANMTRIDMQGPFVKPSGSPDIVVQEGFVNNRQFKANILNSGVYEQLINMASGQGVFNQERIVVNGSEQFRKTYDGEMTWRNQASFDYIRENTIGVRDGGHLYCQGAWNGGTLAMGGYHLWIDASNRLRIKYGLPTSDLDGAAIGGQS